MLVLLGFVTAISTGCTQSELQEKEIFAYEDNLEVYLINGTGGQVHKILGVSEKDSGIRDSVGASVQVYNPCFQPSLSPDRTQIACVRFINYSPSLGGGGEILKIQKFQGIIYRLGDQKEIVFSELPGDIFDKLPDNRKKIRAIASPIWSLDNRHVFFLLGNRILSYSLGTNETHELFQLPLGQQGYPPLRFDNYIRLSKDGKKLFAWVQEPDLSSWYVWEIDLSNGVGQKLWNGNVKNFSYGRTAPFKAPQDLEQEAVEALFGSTDYPVIAPTYGSDRRFYLYKAERPGFFGYAEIGGYDTAEKRSFHIKVLQWCIFPICE